MLVIEKTVLYGTLLAILVTLMHIAHSLDKLVGW